MTGYQNHDTAAAAAITCPILMPLSLSGSLGSRDASELSASLNQLSNVFVIPPARCSSYSEYNNEFDVTVTSSSP